MSDVLLILYDDPIARTWYPFTLTRPAAELRLGAWTLRERAERLFQARCGGIVTDVGLASFDEPAAPPVVGLQDLPTDRLRVFLSSRAVLSAPFEVDRPGSYALQGVTVAVVVPAGAANPTETELCGASGAPANGYLLTRVWELMTRSPEQTAADIASMARNRWTEVPRTAVSLGEPRLLLGANVTIEPHVVLDFSEGPIWLDDDVTVRSFTRLAGPSYVGKGTQILGGSCSAVAIGPLCKVRGELEATVVLGYSNKAHDGFIGHAYIGQWVNLGALTTNSDLKNNYGSIRLQLPEGQVDTGEMKIGCLLGDHVKTAIGTMLNTGTVVGPGSNLFGGSAAKAVRPFSWGEGEYTFEKFIATAETVMSRRQQQLSEKQRRLLRTAWQRGRQGND